MTCLRSMNVTTGLNCCDLEKHLVQTMVFMRFLNRFILTSEESFIVDHPWFRLSLARIYGLAGFPLALNSFQCLLGSPDNKYTSLQTVGFFQPLLFWVSWFGTKYCYTPFMYLPPLWIAYWLNRDYFIWQLGPWNGTNDPRPSNYISFIKKQTSETSDDVSTDTE